GDYDAVLPREGEKTRVFDIGGNIGLYTLYLNGRFGGLEMHVFEPIPALFDLLRHNIRMSSDNRQDNAVFANNVGLAETAGTAVMNYFPHASGLSTLNDDLREKAEAIIHGQVQGVRFPKVREILLRVLRAGF